jgi:hypothetical protein
VPANGAANVCPPPKAALTRGPFEPSVSDNKSAQKFSDWLYHNGYMTEMLFQNTVIVNLSSHGGRVEVITGIRWHRGEIIEDDLEGD